MSASLFTVRREREPVVVRAGAFLAEWRLGTFLFGVSVGKGFLEKAGDGRQDVLLCRFKAPSQNFAHSTVM